MDDIGPELPYFVILRWADGRNRFFLNFIFIESMPPRPNSPITVLSWLKANIEPKKFGMMTKFTIQYICDIISKLLWAELPDLAQISVYLRWI